MLVFGVQTAKKSSNEKNCSIHIPYIQTLNKKWSPDEFDDMSKNTASMPTPNYKFAITI